MKRAIILSVALISVLAASGQSTTDSSLIPRLSSTSNILLMKCDVSVEYYRRTEIAVFYQSEMYIVAHLIVASSKDGEARDTLFFLSDKQKQLLENFGKGIRTKIMDSVSLSIGGTWGHYSYEIEDDRREYTDDRDRSLAKLLLQ